MTADDELEKWSICRKNRGEVQVPGGAEAIKAQGRHIKDYLV